MEILCIWGTPVGSFSRRFRIWPPKNRAWSKFGRTNRVPAKLSPKPSNFARIGVQYVSSDAYMQNFTLNQTMLFKKRHLPSKNNYSQKLVSTCFHAELILQKHVEAHRAHSEHIRRKDTRSCHCTPNFNEKEVRNTENEVWLWKKKFKKKSSRWVSNQLRQKPLVHLLQGS